MPTMIERIHELVAAVDQLTAAGVAPSKEYTQTLERWEAFGSMEPRAAILEQLAAAVAKGESGPWPLDILTMLAFGSSPAPRVEAEVRQHVAASVLPVVAVGARAVGERAHEKLRQRFNGAAEQLVAALDLTDPDVAAESILDAPEATRAAWGSVPTLAAELEKTLALMQVAARLSGVRASAFDLAVTVDPDAPAERRREVWAAWQTEPTSRAGRWKALAGLAHVHLHARALAGLTVYRMPAPIETRYRAGTIGLQPYEHDPELGEPEPGTFGLPR